MSEWSKKVFSNNLKMFMARTGETQKELAEVAGVSEPTFSEWINEKKYPRIDKIQRLADHFGILKSDLIEDKTAVDDMSDVKRQLIAKIKLMDDETIATLNKLADTILSKRDR